MVIGDGCRVGIVGSRRRLDRRSVAGFVNGVPSSCLVVSGGCRGVDAWAVEAARARGMQTRELRPQLAGARNYGEISQRYYDRNQRIVEASDVLVAFVAPDRTGATEDTIRRARQKGIPVQIMADITMTGNKGGRPPHTPTADSRKIVKAMAIARIDQDTIAAAIGVVRDTLKKHYEPELTTSRAVANAKVVANLYRQATRDSPQAIPAAIAWVKMQMGWSDRPPAVEAPGKKQVQAAEAAAIAAGGDDEWGDDLTPPTSARQRTSAFSN